MDVAVSHAVLSAVAAGELEPVFRLHNTRPTLAFGAADRRQAGYPSAVRAARAHRYAPLQRLAGGRAAVFHEDTLAFSIALPDSNPAEGIKERFSMIADAMAEAFQRLGFDARVGELPGEYCPGEWSVNVGGRIKVMGVGQRLVKNAAHIGGVVVVDGGDRVRDILVPVYRHLRIDWDPRTAGALADLSPGLTTEKVADWILAAMGRRFDLQERPLPADVIDRARTLIPHHLARVA